MTRFLARVAAVLIVAPGALAAQRPTFGSTLFWESGLINVPAAYVPPLSGDIAFHFSRLSLGGAESAGGPGGGGSAQAANNNATILGSFWGRAEFGVSIFTADLKNGMFAKLLLVDQMDGAWRRGLLHWLPSVAIGVRNVGSSERQLSRLALPDGGPTLSLSSFFGVATRTFVLSPPVGDAVRPRVQASLTAGHGRGLFSDDGGLGTAYARSATGGTFGGASLDLPLGRFSTLSLMAEHDGWGVNAGARMDLRGVRVALALTEIGAGSGGATAPAPSIVSQKVAITVGWQTNVYGLLRGNRLERSTQRLEQEQADLARQVQIAQQRIDAIEGQIDALHAIERQERSAERVELERMLREEREALTRLQDLIKAREAARRPPQ